MFHLMQSSGTGVLFSQRFCGYLTLLTFGTYCQRVCIGICLGEANIHKKGRLNRKACKLSELLSDLARALLFWSRETMSSFRLST